MSFHGGAARRAGRHRVFAWRRGRKIADVFDFAAPLPALGLFFGRLGNFINGELWGKPTTVPWGFNVDGAGAPRLAALRGRARRPAAVRRAVVVHARPRPRWRPRGCSCCCTALARFLVEFVRVPDEHLGYLAGGWVTMGQMLSLPMILVGISCWSSPIARACLRATYGHRLGQ